MCAGRGAGVPERRRAGASAGAQAYPRTRVPERARVYVCMYRCACVCAYVCARAWVDSSHPLYINPLTERVPVYV